MMGAQARRGRVAAFILSSVALASVAGESALHAQGAARARAARQDLTPTLDGLRWRHIGPAAFGGRIPALAVDATNTATIYVGAASGGIFKSINGGTTWTPVFDDAGGSQSIGALAIAPSDPQVIWAGTGEANNRQSSSWGDGVYRSTDGGKTWTHLGLTETHHVGRIVVHPRDPNTAWVAALGHLWGANRERGVFRTRDGGRTWQHVLAIDSLTGAVDLVLDRDGRTLLAAAYQRQRRGFGFVGGGPGSGIYRSTDGGDTWQRLARGLPTGAIGRIGMEQAASDPNVVYAVIEHRTNGGVYRSDDRGITWRRMNPLNPRPMYYSKVRVDPTNADRVWLLDAYLFESTDGGRTFSSDSTGVGIHVDHHAMWIDPADPRHMLLGNDGGLYETRDRARSWRFLDNLPIAQYYDISVDDATPYMIYGGTQDNGTWALPSRTLSERGIRNADIVHLAYGDGFYTTSDPTNARKVYANSQNGRAYVVDVVTGEQRLIRPVPDVATDTFQFTWSTPTLVSPHDPSVYYYGGNRLFRTRDRGQRWEAISPDLSRREAWRTLPIMGIVRDSTTLSRDDGVSDYGTITTITESPRRAGLLLVGTDDGLVHLTEDAGRTWTDITSRFGLRTPRWVSRVLASQHDARVAYVAFDGHQDADFRPLLYRTADAGRTWQAIGGGIPHGLVINALSEHPDNPDVLLVGTEFGLVVTYDGGRTWKRPAGNLPRVPIDDIVVHPRTRDIVLGTHGRGLIVLDDTRLLAGGDPQSRTTSVLATPGRAAMTYLTRALPSAGAAEFAGENPAPGAMLTYVLPSRSSGAGAAIEGDSVTLIVRDGTGRAVRELRGPGGPGVHRLTWDLRYALPFTPVAADAVWFGPPKGAWVLPGSYTVTLRAPDGERSATLEVVSDPRVEITAARLAARHAAGLGVHELLRAWADADRVLTELARELTPGPGVTVDTTAAFVQRVRALQGLFGSGWGTLKSRILDLHGAVQSSTAEPTEAQDRMLAAYRDEVTQGVAELNAVLADLPAWRTQQAPAGGVPERVRPPANTP